MHCTLTLTHANLFHPIVSNSKAIKWSAFTIHFFRCHVDWPKKTENFPTGDPCLTRTKRSFARHSVWTKVIPVAHLLVTWRTTHPISPVFRRNLEKCQVVWRLKMSRAKWTTIRWTTKKRLSSPSDTASKSRATLLVLAANLGRNQPTTLASLLGHWG